MPSSGRPSLRAIAKATGFSLGTVSRALRDDSAISEPSRDKIKAAAKALGYKPDAEMSRFLTAVRGTSSRHSRETIGLIWTDPPDCHIHDNAYSRRLFRGVKERAESLNFGCDEFFYSPDSRALRGLERVILARGIRGLIIAPHVSSLHFRLELDVSRFHVVSIGRNLVHPVLHRACGDLFGIVNLALRHLHSIGYRRVGLACYDPENERSRHRVSGGYQAFAECTPGFLPLPVYHFKEASDHAGLPAWLAKNRPDCVLAPFDIRAAVTAATPRRLPPPAYACFNVLPGDATTTGVRQPYEQLAAAAVDLLATSLAMNTPGVPAVPRQITVAPAWQAGETAPLRPVSRPGARRKSVTPA